MSVPKRRLFFALWPDGSVVEELAQVLRQLGMNEGKPVDPAKFHITLVFLGDVADDRIGALQNLALRLPFEPCELILDRLEHWVRPAVLCLIASRTPTPLATLVEELRRAVRSLGFKVEKRPFRPHLTVARKVKKRVVGRDIGPISWPVNDFVLVTSKLDAGGSCYTLLGRWPRR